ncbi:MRVI1 domain containing protein [Asbolus verrucosus]|uniref:MRVI1 domain containing protein n=1 Tax=Asbolus verrucosus TaxID=1661398 RepID=A0A482VVF4_ASBVE|nr:MRVI1 domain containing protein [Asbolus verrucosus]
MAEKLSETETRELSKEDVEEKFTTLVLTFTHDSKTSKKRYLNQKEKCDRLLMKFFTYLNYSTDLIRRLNYSEQTGIQKTAVTYLQLLKNISEDVFKAAVQCGVLQYEKRTVNCWNLMINYVATLKSKI